ncbi:helix-turn-helix domain-containing protein [Flavonifractor sp. An306]|uniref:helix-turn-helix domain-containing protein n=1 Tax=Flavonifractor sp. An306 TaxID=1965629 RepID=UPI001748311E|nr:helix-turn-helix domain-containing protein [Flavonifractor sp. An306]
MSYFNEIYGDPELSSKAKMVLLYLHDRSNKKGESWYAISTMSRDLSLSRSTIKRALAELVRQGRVEKSVRFRRNGGYTSNCYFITCKLTK